MPTHGANLSAKSSGVLVLVICPACRASQVTSSRHRDRAMKTKRAWGGQRAPATRCCHLALPLGWHWSHWSPAPHGTAVPHPTSALTSQLLIQAVPRHQNPAPKPAPKPCPYAPSALQTHPPRPDPLSPVPTLGPSSPGWSSNSTASSRKAPRRYARRPRCREPLQGGQGGRQGQSHPIDPPQPPLSPSGDITGTRWQRWQLD